MGLLKLTTWFILKFSEAMEIINEEYKFGEADGIRFFIRFNEGKYGHIHFESKNGEKRGAILLERPQEFEEHFNNDRFKDSFKRVHADIQYHKIFLSGSYEMELIQMLQNVMEKAEVVR